jgi:hypothetical protein
MMNADVLDLRGRDLASLKTCTRLWTCRPRQSAFETVARRGTDSCVHGADAPAETPRQCANLIRDRCRRRREAIEPEVSVARRTSHQVAAEIARVVWFREGTLSARDFAAACLLISMKETE